MQYHKVTLTVVFCRVCISGWLRVGVLLQSSTEGPEEELQPGRIYSSGAVKPVPVLRISSLKTHELY